MNKLTMSLITLIKICLLFFAFFILFPSTHAKAMFSDTTNLSMGIKLELGIVSLIPKDTIIVDSAKFTEGNSVKIASTILVNDGSLSGKLAYKIEVTKENGSLLTANELKNTVISIDFGTTENEVEATVATLNSNSFTFVKSTIGSDAIIEPDSVGKMPVTVSYKNNAPNKEEKLKIKATFRLIQSNAADANANLFSDEVTMENVVSLVPKVVEEESYWPDESKFINSTSGGYSYSLEKMKMVFSETYETLNSEDKEIKNLNKAVLYIKFRDPVTTIVKENGKDKEINTFNFPTVTTSPTVIKVAGKEIDKANNGVKITFELIDKYNSTDSKALSQYVDKDQYSLTLDIGIDKYNNSSNGYPYDYYSHISIGEIKYFATRLVLSTDAEILNSSAPYSQSPIKLTTDDKQISFEKFYRANQATEGPGVFEDVQLVNEDVKLEVIEETAGQVSYSLISKNIFSLGLEPNATFDGAILNVKITGDTKKALVISRKLELQNYLMKIKSTKIPSTTKEVEQQIDSEEKLEESSSMIDSTLPDDQVIEEPIDGDDQEEVKEVIDSSSPDSDAEIKEETVPIENSNQSTSEEKISDEQINE